MFQVADSIFVTERQRTLRQEADNERLARLAPSGAVRRAQPASLAARFGPLVASRLGRLLPVGR